MLKYEAKIKELRAEGLTFGDIGSRLGISKQYVHYIYNRTSTFTDKERELIEAVKYKVIKKWLKKNRVTLREFCRMCGSTQSTNSAICKFLKGEGAGNIYIIRKILEVTGMTFEEAFKED